MYVVSVVVRINEAVDRITMFMLWRNDTRGWYICACECWSSHAHAQHARFNQFKMFSNQVKMTLHPTPGLNFAEYLCLIHAFCSRHLID